MKAPKKYRSDKRLSGGIVDKCKLCDKNTKLFLSHIVPKWCYHWMKEEGKIIGNYPSLGIERVEEQDGNKHYLLCHDCESIIGHSENYCKALMSANNDEMRKFDIVRSNNLLAGIDLKIVKRFIFSIIIRSHYATSAPFHLIQIDENEIENLKKQTLNPTSDDLDYPIIIIRYYSQEYKEINPRSIVIPQFLNQEQPYVFSILLAGWEWLVFFNSNRGIKDNSVFNMNNRIKYNELHEILEDDISINRHVSNRLNKK